VIAVEIAVAGTGQRRVGGGPLPGEVVAEEQTVTEDSDRHRASRAVHCCRAFTGGHSPGDDVHPCQRDRPTGLELLHFSEHQLSAGPPVQANVFRRRRTGEAGQQENREQCSSVALHPSLLSGCESGLTDSHTISRWAARLFDSRSDSRSGYPIISSPYP